MAAPKRMKVANKAEKSVSDVTLAGVYLEQLPVPPCRVRLRDCRQVTHKATTSPTIAVATETVVSVANAERAMASHSTFQYPHDGSVVAIRIVPILIGQFSDVPKGIRSEGGSTA